MTGDEPERQEPGRREAAGGPQRLRRRFRILVVCTGNLFRSPLAAGLLQQGLDDVAAGCFLVDSAGTAGVSGAGVTDDVRRVASAWGIDLGDFRARRLEPADVAAADLVLTMERRHRSHVVTLDPLALRRTFTLREFARIAQRLPAGHEPTSGQRWASLVASAPRYRLPPPEGPESDDVVDPHADWESLSSAMAEQMLPSLHELIDWERRSGSFGSRRS